MFPPPPTFSYIDNYNTGDRSAALEVNDRSRPSHAPNRRRSPSSNSGTQDQAEKRHRQRCRSPVFLYLTPLR